MSCLKNNYQKDLYPINVNVKELKDSNSIVEAILANYSGPKSELESIDPTNYNTNTNIFIQDIRTYLIDKKVPENIVQEVEKTLLSRLTQDTQPENESLEEDNDAQIPTNDKVERTLSDYYAEAFSDDRLLRREFEESFGSEAFESLIVNYTEKTLIVGLDDLNRNIIQFQNRLYNIIYKYLKNNENYKDKVEQTSSIYVEDSKSNLYNLREGYINNINLFSSMIDEMDKVNINEKVSKGKRDPNNKEDKEFAEAFEAFLKLQFFDKLLLKSFGKYLYINTKQAVPIEQAQGKDYLKYKYSINKKNVNISSGWQNQVRDGVDELGSFTQLIIEQIPLLDARNVTKRHLFKTEFFTSMLRLRQAVSQLQKLQNDKEITALVNNYNILAVNPRKAWKNILEIVVNNPRLINDLKTVSAENDPITTLDFDIWRSVYYYLFQTTSTKGRKMGIEFIENKHIGIGKDFSCYSIVDALIGSLNSVSQANYIDFIEKEGQLVIGYKPKYWSKQRLYSFIKNINDRIIREDIPELDNSIDRQIVNNHYEYSFGEYKIIFPQNDNLTTIFDDSPNIIILDANGKAVQFGEKFRTAIRRLDSEGGRNTLLQEQDNTSQNFMSFLRLLDNSFGTHYSTSDAGLQQFRILIQLERLPLKQLFMSAARIAEAYTLNKQFKEDLKNDDLNLTIFDLQRWLDTSSLIKEYYPDFRGITINGNSNFIIATQRGNYIRGLEFGSKVADYIVEAETVYYGDNNSSTTKNLDQDNIPNVSVAFTDAKQELIQQGITVNSDSIMGNLLFAGTKHSAIINTAIDMDIQTRYGTKQISNLSTSELLLHDLNKFILGSTDFGNVFLSQPVTYSDKTKFLQFVVKYDKIGLEIFKKDDKFEITEEEYINAIQNTIGKYYTKLFNKIFGEGGDYKKIFNENLSDFLYTYDIDLYNKLNDKGFFTYLIGIDELQGEDFAIQVNKILMSGLITKEDLLKLADLQEVELFEELHYRSFDKVLTVNEMIYDFQRIYKDFNELNYLLKEELIQYCNTLLNKSVLLKIKDESKEFELLKRAINKSSIPSSLKNTSRWITENGNMIYAYRAITDEEGKTIYQPILWGDKVVRGDIINPLIFQKFYLSNLINGNLKIQLSGTEAIHPIKGIHKVSPSINSKQANFLQRAGFKFKEGRYSIVSYQEILKALETLDPTQLNEEDYQTFQSIINNERDSFHKILSKGQKVQFKRTVPITGTMRLFTQNTIKGIPSEYNVAIVKDLRANTRDFVGDYGFGKEDSIDAHDGSAWVDPFTSILENNSLEDSRAGEVKKPIWDINEYKVGGRRLVKYASNTITNRIMLNSLNSSISMYKIFKKMTNMQWKNDEIDLIDDWAITEYDADYNQSFTDNILNNDKLFYSHDGKYYKIVGFNKEIINGQKVYYTLEQEVTAMGRLRDRKAAPKKVYHLFNKQSNHFRFGEGESFDLTKYHTINSLFELHSAMGGIESCSLVEGKLEYSEVSNQVVANFMIYVSKARTSNVRNVPITQEYYYQPLKRKLINCLINQSAIKNGTSKLNPKETLFNDENFRYTTFSTLKYGIQQDSDHTADEGTVTEMSQVISALDATGLYHDEILKIYESIGLQSLQAAGIELNSLKDYNKFYGVIGRTILNNINKDLKGLTKAILYQIRKEFKFDYDHQMDEFKIPFSDPNIYNKLLSIVGNILNKKSIKRKYPGLGQVMVPSYGIYQIWEIEGRKYQYKDILNKALKYNNTLGKNKIPSNGIDPIVFNKRIVEQYLNQIEEFKESNTILYDGYWNDNNIQDIDPTQSILIEYQDEDGEFGKTSITLDSLEYYYALVNYDTQNLQDITRILEKQLGKNISIERILIDKKKPRDLAPTRIKFKYLDEYGEEKKANIYNTWLYKDLYKAIQAKNDLEIKRLKGKIPDLFKKLEQGIYETRNGKELEITSLDNLPAEVIMSNIYASKFGLNPSSEVNDVQEESFYIDVNILNNKVNDYDLQLVTSNGNNIYISIDSPIENSKHYLIRPKSWGTNISPEEYISSDPNNKVVARVYNINSRNEKEFEIGRYIKVNDVQQNEAGKFVYKNTTEHHVKGELVEGRTLKLDNKGNIIEYIEFVKKYEIRPKKGRNYIKYNIDSNKLAQCYLPEERLYKKGNKQRKISKGTIIGNIVDEIYQNNSYLFISPGQYVDNNKSDLIKDILSVVRSNSTDTHLKSYISDVIKLIGIKKADGKQADLENINVEQILNNVLKGVNVKYKITDFPDVKKDGTIEGGVSDSKIKNIKDTLEDILDDGNISNKEQILQNFQKLVDSKRISSYRKKLLKAKGAHKLSSFKKSLYFISSRIPAQTLQSFMKMECVGFNGIGTNYCAVSHFQAFLQGSDYDIDKSYMLGFSFDDNGLFIGWSSLFDLSSFKNLEISTKLPLPRKNTYTLTNTNNKQALDISKYVSTYISQQKQLKTLRDQNNTQGIIQLRSSILNNVVELINYIYKNSNKDGNQHVSLYANYEDSDIEYVNDLLQNKLNKHENTNLGINSNAALLNFIASNIQNISQKLQNMPANYAPVTMSDLQDTLENCPKQLESDDLTLFNPAMVPVMQVINMEGKQGTGIAANGQKGLFLWRFGVLEVLKSGKDIEQVLFDVNINRIQGRDNYNKTHNIEDIRGVSINTLPGFDQYGENLRCLYPIKTTDNTGSQYISAATDNAKELILSVINSGTNLMKYHLYLLSLGFDVKDIVAFMTSPIISLVDDFIKDDIFTGTKISIQKAIKFIESYLSNPEKAYMRGVDGDLLTQFKKKLSNLFDDVVPESEEYNILKEEFLQDIETLEQITPGANEYTTFSRMLSINQGIAMTKEDLIKWKRSFKQAALEGLKHGGLLDSYGNIQNDEVIKYLKLKYEGNEDITDEDFIKKYNEYFKDINPDLDDQEKLIEFFKKENILFNFDMDRWLNDEQYRDTISEEYNKYKSTINVFYLINKIPHIKNMFDVANFQNQVDIQTSLKSKLIDYYSEAFDNKFKNVSPKFKMKMIAPIDRLIISHYMYSLGDNIVTIPLKDGWQVFDSKLTLYSNTQGQLRLDNSINESSFKYVFENYIIPALKSGTLFDNNEENNIIKNNLFIKLLVRGTEKDKPIYKLDLDMSQKNSNKVVAEQYQDCLNSMKELQNIKYGNYSILNLFMVYNLLINRNQYGSDRFTEIFEDYIDKDKNSFLYKYLQFIGNGDYKEEKEALFNSIIDNVTFTDLGIEMANIVSPSLLKLIKDPYVKVRKDIDSPIQVLEYGEYGYDEDYPINFLVPIVGESNLEHIEREVNYIEYGQGTLYSQYIKETLESLKSNNYKEVLNTLIQNLTITYNTKCK